MDVIYKFVIEDGHGHMLGGALMCMVISGRVKSMKAATVEKKFHMDAMYMRFIASILHMVSLWCVVISGAVMAGIEVTSLRGYMITSGSLVVGMASKDTLGNFVSALMLISDRPFDIGDKVKIGGITAVVVSVGFFQTKLKTGDNDGIIMPNGAIMKGTIINRHESFDVSGHQLRKVSADFWLEMKADLGKAIKALEEAGDEVDKTVVKLHDSEDIKDFPEGKMTLAQYYKSRFRGRELSDDTAKQVKRSVKVCGQDISSGHHLQLSTMCESSEEGKVSQLLYIEGVTSFQKNGVPMFEPK